MTGAADAVVVGQQACTRVRQRAARSSRRRRRAVIASPGRGRVGRVGSGGVRREQRATILDVAARAGVHAATVSRTINVPEKVAPETRRRVEAAVTGARLRPEPCRAWPDHRAHRQRRRDRSRHHQPPLRIAGALGRAVGPAERSAGPPGRHRGAPGRGGAGRGIPVPGGRRVHRRLAAPPAPRPRRLGAHAGRVRQPPGPRARVHPPADGARRGRRPAAPGRARAHAPGLPGRTERIVGGGGAPQRSAAAPAAPAGSTWSSSPWREPTFDATAVVVPDVVASGASAVLAFNDQMALGVDRRPDATVGHLRSRGRQRRGVRRRARWRPWWRRR